MYDVINSYIGHNFPWILATLTIAIPYLFILVKIVSWAFFTEKIAYQRKFYQELDRKINKVKESL